jgi:hypothetical protein
MEPGPNRASRHAQDLGDLVKGQAAVVLQHDRGALLRAERPKRSLEKIAIGHGAGGIGLGIIRIEQTERGRLPSLLPQLVVAGSDQHPVRPGLDQVRVSEAGQVSPQADERHLERIAGGVEVAQDPMRHREQAVAQLERKAGECLAVASSCLLHQRAIHRCLPVRSPFGSVHSVWRLPQRE